LAIEELRPGNTPQRFALRNNQNTFTRAKSKSLWLYGIWAFLEHSIFHFTAFEQQAQQGIFGVLNLQSLPSNYAERVCVCPYLEKTAAAARATLCRFCHFVEED
jgi:hypothetical protein